MIGRVSHLKVAYMTVPSLLILFHILIPCNFYYIIKCNRLILYKIGKGIGIAYTYVIFLILYRNALYNESPCAVGGSRNILPSILGLLSPDARRRNFDYF